MDWIQYSLIVGQMQLKYACAFFSMQFLFSWCLTVVGQIKFRPVAYMFFVIVTMYTAFVQVAEQCSYVSLVVTAVFQGTTLMAKYGMMPKMLVPNIDDLHTAVTVYVVVSQYVFQAKLARLRIVAPMASIVTYLCAVHALALNFWSDRNAYHAFGEQFQTSLEGVE